MRNFILVVFAVALAGTLSVGCGAVMSQDVALTQLREAITRKVNSPEESQENSRTVEKVLDQNHLHGLFRREVEEKIGRGDPCSRHPRCAENGFLANDWFYTVGEQDESYAGALPVMIVGFDTSGRVTRTWNLTTH